MSEESIKYIEELDNHTLNFQGEWNVFNVPDIEIHLQYLKKQNYKTIYLNGITEIDTAGAFLIKKYFGDVEIVLSKQQQKLFDFLPDKLEPQLDEERNGIRQYFIEVGKKTFNALTFCFDIITFTGKISLKLMGCFLKPRQFRLPSIVRHIDETGLKALPIIGLLGLLTSMVVSYQAALQLEKFGASIFTIDLTVISLLREMGVLITAIMVAGRSGSAFAAEIGVMKLRGEVDAMRTMGLDPIETLVLPRILALLITLPLLTFFANMVGLMGGALMSETLLDIPWTQYIGRVEQVATPAMFFVGMIKAPVFALLIAIICCYQGMNVTGSAESVGRLTTIAVVQSIFLVIMADAVFSIIFAFVGI